MAAGLTDMKAKLEFKENWQLRLLFEFSPDDKSLEELDALGQRLIEASSRNVPVNLLSFYQIDHMWRSDNGAVIDRNTTIGKLKKARINRDPTQHPLGVWIEAQIELLADPAVVNRLKRHALQDEYNPQSLTRPDFVAFPRMRVEVTPVSLVLPGEKGPRMRFRGFGPLLAIDCVYGAVVRRQYQTIQDANYAKKHMRDIIPPK